MIKSANNNGINHLKIYIDNYLYIYGVVAGLFVDFSSYTFLFLRNLIHQDPLLFCSSRIIMINRIMS